MNPFRVAVLIDQRNVPRSVAELVERVKEQPRVEIDCFVIGDKRAPRPWLSQTAKRALLSFIRITEQVVIAIVRRPPKPGGYVDVESIIGGEVRHLCLAHQGSSKTEDAHPDWNDWAHRDVFINASQAISNVELARISKTTVLSSSASRGATFVGFVETYERRPAVEFSVSMSTPESSAETILIRGRLQTQLLYVETMRAVADNANHYLLKVVAALGAGTRVPTSLLSDNRTFTGPREPSVWNLVSYPVRLSARLARKLAPRLINRRFKWTVAATRDDWQQGLLTRHVTLDNKPSSYSADPFLVRRDGDLFCFLEEFSFTTGKGTIVCCRIDAQRFERLGVALEEGFHLSFPFVFEADGHMYMCPETSASRDVRIYECTEFPLQWRLCNIALSNILAADTVVFRHQGRWWLITCVNPLGRGTQFSELCIFSAVSLTDRDWTPHALNPIKIDEVTARSGGFFALNDAIYRVNQVQGFDVYGEAVGISKIVQLDQKTFREDPIRTLEMREAGVIGVHHFSTIGELSVFDFSSYT